MKLEIILQEGEREVAQAHGAELMDAAPGSVEEEELEMELAGPEVVSSPSPSGARSWAFRRRWSSHLRMA